MRVALIVFGISAEKQIYITYVLYINARSSILAIPHFQRGQGGFFTTKTIYNSRTWIHEDTHNINMYTSFVTNKEPKAY